jgi:hypothetical protein
MTLCSMVIEAGGKNGVVPPDSTTYKYLEVHAFGLIVLSLSLFLYIYIYIYIYLSVCLHAHRFMF